MSVFVGRGKKERERGREGERESGREREREHNTMSIVLACLSSQR